DGPRCAAHLDRVAARLAEIVPGLEIAGELEPLEIVGVRLERLELLVEAGEQALQLLPGDDSRVGNGLGLGAGPLDGTDRHRGRVTPRRRREPTKRTAASRARRARALRCARGTALRATRARSALRRQRELEAERRPHAHAALHRHLAAVERDRVLDDRETEP